MDLMIFDCDGVLADSELLSNGLRAEMMSELGVPMTTTCAIRTFAGRGLPDVLAPHDDRPGADLVEKSVTSGALIRPHRPSL
jgi:beta-phosphoglucomutase-like phosphatase (HAD superfamily)